MTESLPKLPTFYYFSSLEAKSARSAGRNNSSKNSNECFWRGIQKRSVVSYLAYEV